MQSQAFEQASRRRNEDHLRAMRQPYDSSVPADSGPTSTVSLLFRRATSRCIDPRSKGIVSDFKAGLTYPSRIEAKLLRMARALLSIAFAVTIPH
jgi:hypothetical protein